MKKNIQSGRKRAGGKESEINLRYINEIIRTLL